MKEATKQPKPRRLSLKQRKFIDKYLETGNATQSALNVYDTEYNTARAIGSENLSKPAIYQEIQSRIQEDSKRARERMRELIESEDDLRVSYLASKDVLDRAGHVAVTKSVNVSVKKAINLDI